MNNLRTTKLMYTHRILLLALSCTLISGLVSLDILAECPTPPPTSSLGPGEVGLFFDPAGTLTCDEVTIGAVVSLYLVARTPDGGIASYSISELLTASAVTFVGHYLPQYAPFDIIVLIDACSTAERTDPESCPATEGELLVLAIYDVMFFASSGTICFQTACPTIAGLVPMSPLYMSCDTENWGELVGGNSMCIGLGEEPVSTDPSSWGKIKSLYAGD